MLPVTEDYAPPTLDELRAAARLVNERVPPTLQHNWPVLSQACGCEVWMKHENHTPIGAFKVRGGLTYLDALVKSQRDVAGIVTATSGNHGQSVTFAANRYGLPVTVVAPEPGAVEKKAAMSALGARVIEHGANFNDAFDHARELARSSGWHFMPSFHPLLVLGVASYSLELFDRVSDLDTVYVPIGLGSGICGMIHARDALNLKTKIVGVVPAAAPTYSLSFQAGRIIEAEIQPTILDSLINRTVAPLALDIIRQGVERIVEISDEQAVHALRLCFTATHNLAEPGGAAALAALWSERDRLAGCKVGVVLTGANADMDSYHRYIA